MNSLSVAAVQMTSAANFDENIAQAEKLIRASVSDGANLVVLPEYFAFMGLAEKDKFDYVEQPGKGPLQNWLSGLSAELNVWIVAGSHPIASSNPLRPFGRCYVYNNQGVAVVHYDKIHLFDVQVEDSTGAYCESKYSMEGNEAVCFDSPWGKMGLAICYDLRFPELFRQLAEQGCKLFILPAAFTYETGKLHWETLIKARAIENLCYFVASAQTGIHQNKRETWGHSIIVSPWGETLAEKADGVGSALSLIDFNKQLKLRKEFPALSHKRL